MISRLWGYWIDLLPVLKNELEVLNEKNWKDGANVNGGVQTEKLCTASLTFLSASEIAHDANSILANI